MIRFPVYPAKKSAAATDPGKSRCTPSATFEAVHHNSRQLDFVDGKLLDMQLVGMQDHSDEDLRRLEAYVGRIPSFDRAAIDGSASINSAKL